MTHWLVYKTSQILLFFVVKCLKTLPLQIKSKWTCELVFGSMTPKLLVNQYCWQLMLNLLIQCVLSPCCSMFSIKSPYYILKTFSVFTLTVFCAVIDDNVPTDPLATVQTTSSVQTQKSVLYCIFISPPCTDAWCSCWCGMRSPQLQTQKPQKQTTHQLPLKSLSLGYKHEKARLVFALKDSADICIQKAEASVQGTSGRLRRLLRWLLARWIIGR